MARTLTETGGTLSRWRLPAWMHPDSKKASLSYHLDRNRWSPRDSQWCALQSVGKGQEFVLAVQDEGSLRDWLATLFSDV